MQNRRELSAQPRDGVFVTLTSLGDGTSIIAAKPQNEGRPCNSNLGKGNSNAQMTYIYITRKYMRRKRFFTIGRNMTCNMKSKSTVQKRKHQHERYF